MKWGSWGPDRCDVLTMGNCSESVVLIETRKPSVWFMMCLTKGVRTDEIVGLDPYWLWCDVLTMDHWYANGVYGTGRKHIDIMYTYGVYGTGRKPSVWCKVSDMPERSDWTDEIGWVMSTLVVRYDVLTVDHWQSVQWWDNQGRVLDGLEETGLFWHAAKKMSSKETEWHTTRQQKSTQGRIWHPTECPQLPF